MISYLCSTDHSMKNLFNLVYKIYKHSKDKILIIFDNEQNMHLVDESFWKFRKFLPHSTDQSEYRDDQPILLSQKIHDGFAIHIYFHHAPAKYENVQNVLWNPESSKAKGKIWKEDNGKWVLG